MSTTKPTAPIRALSILMGVIIGSILAYAYQMNLPTLFNEMNVATLVVFVAVPLIAGFIVGLLHPAMAFRNGLYAGLLIGLFNSIIAAIKLIFSTQILKAGDVYAFSLFAIMSVFIWTILAAMAAALAAKFYE